MPRSRTARGAVRAPIRPSPHHPRRSVPARARPAPRRCRLDSRRSDRRAAPKRTSGEQYRQPDDNWCPLGRLRAMPTAPTATMPITGDPAADELLVSDPLALLIGMLLDQQVPMEWAFRGPATLRERLGALDAAAIAAMTPEALDAVFRAKPALHRFPSSMAKRTHALCAHLVEHYEGDAAR